MKSYNSNALKEVAVIINNLIPNDYKKIPKQYIDFFEKNCNKEYEFNYDKSKSFKEQQLLEETKMLLFVLFEEFGASDKQKSVIQAFKINKSKKLEEIKRKKYNPDSIF